MNVDDPIALFLDCREAARLAGEPLNATCVALATATSAGVPSVRHVLVKEVGSEGFYIYTNYDSDKARELDSNPVASLCFHFVTTHVQFRVTGPVERASAERSDAYFAARPRESQLGAWGSEQSRPLASRDVMVERVAEVRDRFAEQPVPRPANWGGYRLMPERIEYWVDRPFRLHDRFVFVRTADGWSQTRLYP